MSFNIARSPSEEEQSRGQIYSDRVPALLRSHPRDIVSELRNIVASPSPLWERATRTLVLLDSYAGHTRPTPQFSGVQRGVFWHGGRSGSDRHLQHCVLRLHVLVETLGGTSPLNLTWCLLGKGTHYYAMCLRRLLEVVSGAPSWRYRPPPPVEVAPTPPPEPVVPLKVRETIFCENRFARLADYELGTGADDDSWVEKILEPGYPETINKVTPAQRKHVTQADTNRTRVSMGYAPKGAARVDDDTYREAKKAYEHEVSVRSLVKHILIPYARDALERSGDVDELHTTTVRYYFALRRWSEDYCKIFGLEEGHPAGWDPGLGILPDL